MTNPLFILPFDHRTSFARDLLGASYPVNRSQKKQFADLKNIIFDGLLYAKKRYRGDGVIATIIDEEFGATVIKNAKIHHVPIALTMETPGHEAFGLIDGARFGKRLEKIQPTFAKALIYYEVGDEKKNVLARALLKKLSTYCEKNGFDFMLELLIQNKGPKAKWAGKIINEIEGAGIRPTVWKIEALETVKEWTALARHTTASIIILGRGESKAQVDTWVKTAAKSQRTIGFAVGRTVFLRPLQNFVRGKIDRAKAMEIIGKNFLHYIRLWEQSMKK